jgi:hypothetical protein
LAKLADPVAAARAMEARVAVGPVGLVGRAEADSGGKADPVGLARAAARAGSVDLADSVVGPVAE